MTTTSLLTPSIPTPSPSPVPASSLPPIPVASGQTARQGDLILVPLPEAPSTPSTPVPPSGTVVASGRASHIIRGDASIIPLNGPHTLCHVIVGPGGALLTHERSGEPAEHRSLSLQPNSLWTIHAQRTLDITGEVRRALD